jgi:hypothetical protein
VGGENGLRRTKLLLNEAQITKEGKEGRQMGGKWNEGNCHLEEAGDEAVWLGAEGDLEAVQLVDPGGELLQAARVLHHRQLTQPAPRSRDNVNLQPWESRVVLNDRRIARMIGQRERSESMH